MTDLVPPLPSVAGLSPREMTAASRAARLAESGDIDGLLAMLDDPSWKVRRRVVDHLASSGAAAVEPLCEVLRTRRDNEDRVAAAVDALSASTTSDDTPIWRLAKYRSAAVAADAAQILGRRRQSDSVPLLVLLLANKDDNVAVAAIEALGRIGGVAAVDALLECLQSDNFFRVFPAIELLGRSGDPRAVKPLAQLLDRPHYAREAARALGRTGELGAVAPLVRHLTDPRDSMVRLSALSLAELDMRYRERYGGEDGIDTILAQTGSASAAADRLCRALPGADTKEQAAIAMVLGSLAQEDAVPALSKLLDGPVEVASAAAKALERIGNRAGAEIRRALRDGTSGERLAVLPFCAKKQTVADVLYCLSDEDPRVRALAAATLGKIGDASIVERLFPLLADSDLLVMQAATAAIQSLGSDEARALALRAARADSPQTRRAALRILAYFGEPSSFEVFRESIGDPDPRVRDVAVLGLAFIDDSRATETLLAACRNDDAKMRAAAARALGLRAPLPAAAEALITALADRDPWVRYYACQSLGRLRHEAASELVARLLADPAGQVRVAAVEALCQLPTEVAFGALREAVQSPESDVKRAALIGLGLAKREGSVPLLVEALTQGEPATRLVAVSALASFPDRDVIAAWSRAALDRDPSVQKAALTMLAGRDGPEATTALIRLLASSRADVDAVLAALATPVSGRVETILGALHTADDDLSQKLTSVLARMRRPDAHEALLRAFEFSNAACRKAAATALAAVRSPDGLLAIRRASMIDRDPQLKQICSLLLAE